MKEIEGLVDGRARHAIRTELDRTLVVEAAAGTGKTTELVQRIVAMVETGRARLSSIVSVTFTEKAAGEMKLRIRTELDRALGEERSSEARERLLRALSELETAKMGTIHALCADLLREHPIEAGTDPAFQVADGMTARALFERAFDGWFERTLDDPPEGVRRVLARRAFDPQAEGAREQLARAASSLSDRRDFATPYRRDPLDRVAAVEEMLRELTQLATLASQSSMHTDPLRRSLRELGQRLAQVPKGDVDAGEAFLRQLRKDRRKVWSSFTGRGRMFAPSLERAEVVERRAQSRQHLEDCVQRLDADLAACLSRELLPILAAYEEEKRASGALDFFDLLLHTRDLLRDHDAVRQRVQGEVTHLFVDEFQDTDPVQSEILLLLAADEPGERDPWRAVPVPGKLFVVGDPKQSIYRFRRADVALYERIKQHLLERGAALLSLSTSFRSLPAIQSLVNASFGPLMQGAVERGQASYVALSPFRAARAGQPALIALPAPKPFSEWGKVTKKAVEQSLPSAVGAWVDWLVRKSGYHVQEGGVDVPVQPRHVCLLFKRYRAWGVEDVSREYVRALEARGVPHVLSGGRSFHTREEVIALRATLSAIEWPDDALNVYATLRGPFLAFHDELLLRFKQRVRHLHPLGPVERAELGADELEVADALAFLAELHRKRNQRPIAHTIAAFLHHFRVHAGVAIWPTGEQALGNVLRLLDYGRSYERGCASSFRGFVEWLALHAELGEAADAPVIEESSDGVRIMTVHAAKGLEFPIVVLCDPGAPIQKEFASRYIDVESQIWAEPLCDAEPAELFEHRELVQDHDEAESVRITYVAATRAKEMLVVPVVGEGRIDGWTSLLAPGLYPPPERRRSAIPAAGCPAFTGDSVMNRPVDSYDGPEASVAPGEHVPMLGEHRVVWWDPWLLDLDRRASGGVTQQDLLKEDSAAQERGLAEYEAYRLQRSVDRAAGARPSLRTRAITELAGELTDEVVVAPATHELIVIDSGATRDGRPSGKRFGTLMHALFEHAVLAGGPDASARELEGLSRFVARSLGATEAERTRAVSDVALALRHPLFERIERAHARGELFREAPVTSCPEAGELREGIVDLAFREHGKMVLVDFKTDVVIAEVTRYAQQLSLYAGALEKALGEPVECVLFRV
ncbi:MAG TPA: UvrD-helicase domain-containing protein [Polyangiales bacterium]|nr:UvrD-helicase domain-containing protein [Polyangiales bacterium]